MFRFLGDMDISGWLSGVSQKVAADILKWVAPIVGPPVIAWLRSKNLRWATIVFDAIIGWVCLYILFYGFTTEPLMSFTWWGYLIAGGSLAFVLFLDWRRGERAMMPVTTELPPPKTILVSPQDEAKKEKIAVLYRSRAALASEKLQEIVNETFEHFNRGGDPRNVLIAHLAHEGPFHACNTAHNDLHRMVETPERLKVKVEFHTLQDQFAVFFLAYQVLVREMHQLNQPTVSPRPLLNSKAYTVWSEH